MSTQTSKFKVTEIGDSHLFHYISPDTIKILHSSKCIVSFISGDHHNDPGFIKVASTTTATVAEVIYEAVKNGKCCEFSPTSFQILMELENLGCTTNIENGDPPFFKVKKITV